MRALVHAVVVLGVVYAAVDDILRLERSAARRGTRAPGGRFNASGTAARQQRGVVGYAENVRVLGSRPYALTIGRAALDRVRVGQLVGDHDWSARRPRLDVLAADADEVCPMTPCVW
jgi:hypothetical protein